MGPGAEVVEAEAVEAEVVEADVLPLDVVWNPHLAADTRVEAPSTRADGIADGRISLSVRRREDVKVGDTTRPEEVKSLA